ncbi:MAG: hypothetical protein H0T79_22455 [Deltaproteobacteria bacterium]|nr:hypothetical protein [Deltaproteobacteria bacterium]
MASRVGQVAKVVVGSAVRIVWISTMVLTPLFGFWLASSLAAFQNASQWVALLVGLALFPIIPVAWELFATWRRSKQPAAKSILTRLDRLVLRTLLLNGVFLGITLWRAPQTSFRALAVRGDWILDGHHGPIASGVRGFLLGFADRFERRWHADDDTYGESDKPPEPPADDDTHDDAPPRPATPEDVAPPKYPRSGWPLPAEADVQVLAIPLEAQTSPEAVGAYLKERFPEPRRLVKAIHDYVVLRLTYDDAALAASLAKDYARRPSQKAEDVFAAKLAVCEGYARLTVAIGKAAGVEIAYITGYIRDAERRVASTAMASDDTIRNALEGYLHAWNAAKIDGEWYLLDPTWDDPKSESGEASLRSTYLFTPPRYFRYDHLPEDAAWQLVASPITPGDFVRQPILSPYSGELGISLISPTRSQVTVDTTLEIVVDNPYRAELVASASVPGSTAKGESCTVVTSAGVAPKTTITCALGHGEYEIRMFGVTASEVAAAKASAKPGERYGWSYDYVGTILANSR